MPARYRFYVGIAVLYLLAITAPTLAAVTLQGDAHVFGGILINQADGYSYFAKMYQGWQGGWLFHLPYTAETSGGAFFHFYYISMGHIARWMELSIPFTYHFFRVAGSLLLLVALYRFFTMYLQNESARRTAFTLAAVGLGMGWLSPLLNTLTADLWVAEAYPFLSGFTNAHFPLGLALILFLALPRQAGFWGAAGTAGLAFLLGIISPFGVVIALLPWAGAFLWEVGNRREALRALIAISVGGLPVLAYDWLAIRADPQLAAWDAQNITASPVWWDLLIALSPVLLLAVFGWRRAPGQLAGWAALGLALIFIPFELQRRFMLGLYVPLCGLAALGLEAVFKGRRAQRVSRGALTLLVLPTPLLILLSTFAAMASRDVRLYLSPGELAAYTWLAEAAPADSLVLASPESGLRLPAFTGQRVIYGHPFETVNAEVELAAVEAFFGGMDAAAAEAFLAGRGVDYVLWGPREQALGTLPPMDAIEVFAAGGVQIYEVAP